jgi:hypothetical protein
LPVGEHGVSFREHVFDQASGTRGRRQMNAIMSSTAAIPAKNPATSRA